MSRRVQGPHYPVLQQSRPPRPSSLGWCFLRRCPHFVLVSLPSQGYVFSRFTPRCRADNLGALLWPIFLVAIISWPRSTPVTHFPHDALGDSDFEFFKHVVSARSFKLLGPQNVDFSAYKNGKVWIALISFLYVDLLDTTGTLVAMSKQAGLFDARDGDFEGSSVAFMVDSICIAMSGLLFGTSPATPFVESASGISEGGRTGLTAIATSFWFFVSIFFAPILSNIPSFATGSVLIVVGALMMGNVTKINFDYPGDAIPAFVALALIPFTCKSA
jgi:AGZA family xanthine/uracil permease-like MFS transporter